jgi:transposase
MLLIGIDWADDHHDAAFMDEAGNILEEFRFTHDQAGFDLLHERIKRFDVAPEEVLVAIETNHGLLIHDLVRSHYTVYPLNPKAVSRYKDRLRSSDKKDDKLDARTMANVLRTDRHLHRQLVVAPDDYRLLERLCLDLNTIIGDISRISNRLLDSLKDHYPAAIGSFGIDTDIFLAFLAQYPTPESLELLTESQFMSFLKANRYSVQSKKTEIFQHLKRRTPKADRVASAAGRIRTRSLVDQMVVLRASRKSYEQQIKELLESLPEADIISSLPGVGKRLLPEITAMFGPNLEDAPKRFEQAAEAVRLSGCAPVTKQSGKFKAVSARRSCNKTMRRITRNWAGCSITASRWAKAFYDWHRLLCDSHETILRKLATKWIKIAFRLWRTGERYNEEIYINALKQRNVVWAARL